MEKKAMFQPTNQIPKVLDSCINCCVFSRGFSTLQRDLPTASHILTASANVDARTKEFVLDGWMLDQRTPVK
jgi:hypothetical protein